MSLATVRDNDTSLWLHNKLGSIESWTSGSISAQLNAEVLRNIKDCFVDLQTQVKLKLLLSFFHIPRRNIEEWKIELEEIIEVAQVDSEQWVSMLAEMMKSYPETNHLLTRINDADETARIYYDLIASLGVEIKRADLSSCIPLECHYLNIDVMNQTIKSQKPQPPHFVVKKKPKSGLLRSDLVIRATEAAEHSAKKIPAPTIPLRTRGMPRKMTDTTPLKGIPSQAPAVTRSPGISVQPRVVPRPAAEKKGGIKVLDINEQPLAYAQTKRRKKTLDADDLKKNSQSSEETGAQGTGETPDYAAGLNQSGKPPTPPPPTPLLPPATPSSFPPPATPQYISAPPTPASNFTQTVILDGPPPTPNPTPRSENPPTIPNQMTSHLSTYLPVAANNSHVINNSPRKVTNAMPTVQTLTKTVILQVANHQPQQIVTLSKELMEQAQDIFRTSNRATRPEKEHILKFMAGTRENPCPELGNIVTIKLSEQQEPVRQSDGTVLPLCVETHFQMNYNTGEWKVITKPPKLDTSHKQKIISNI